MNDPRVPEIEARARLQHLQACVFPILAEIDDRAGVHGSASLFQRDGRHYAVTATHVAKYLETHAEVLAAPTAVQTGASEAWSFGRGTLAKTGEDVEDVAVFRLDEPAVVRRLLDGGHLFLGDDDVERDPGRASTCGVFGWPAAAAHQDGWVVRGQALVMLLRRMPPPPNSRLTDVFLEWPDADDVPKLPGISGSPLWAVSAATGFWHPSKEIKLLGVQHTSLPGRWIKGTSWNVVDRLIESLAKP